MTDAPTARAADPTPGSSGAIAAELLSFRPADPDAEGKRRLAAAVVEAADEIIGLSHRIHANPETAFGEVQASGWIAETLARHGFQVEHPAGSLATAIRARKAGGRGEGPRIGILAEYDALPGLGHGCGHNTMAASGVGAAIALAAISDDLRGEIVFLGTPAEERGSGKQIMIDDGLFAGLDAALLYHPCDRNHVQSFPLASEDVEVVFHGLQAHASSDPWRGKNALDAMILLFASVGLWRQQLTPDARVHGIIQEGGMAPNIIPDRTRAWFMLRSADQERYAAMATRFHALVDAAALATDTSAEVTFSGGAMTMKPNATLEARWIANAVAYGIDDEGPDPNSGSTDMGNVSWVCPTIHPDLSIAAAGTPGHSTDFRDAAATPVADRTTLLAAILVGQTALELFADPELVAAAWRDFRAGGDPKSSGSSRPA
ncbi:MAG: M20 family metallopeptidase [Myxococcales bacterium]